MVEETSPGSGTGGAVPYRRLVVIALIVASACSPSPAGTEAGGSTATNPDASEVEDWETVLDAVDLEDVGRVVEAASAGLRNVGGPRDGEPNGPQDIVEALVAIDWFEAIGGDGAAVIAVSFERATVSAGTLALFEPSPATGSRALLVMADARPTPASVAFDVGSADQTDGSAQSEVSVSGGSTTGTVTGNATQTFDPESGRVTIEWTSRIDVTDSETGERTIAETTVQVTFDACWGEDGTRQAQVTTTTTVTTTTSEGATTVESSRSTEARIEPDGSFTSTFSATVDGVTVTAGQDVSELSGPSNTEFDDDGETITLTAREGQTTMTVSGSRETWSQDPDDFMSKQEQALEEALDTEKATRDAEVLGQALEPPMLSTSRGGNEFCLRLSVNPSSAALEPDGETLDLNTTVLDWNGRPVVSAVLAVSGARLGSVDPQLGPSSTEGTWTTTYTSGKEGSETLTFEASHYGYAVKRTTRIDIGSSTWALAMTLEIDDVTFLWDGAFSVVGGEIDGGGIGTAVGTAQCVWESSSGHYSGPIAQVSGDFTFKTYGSASLEGKSGPMSLRVETREGDSELSYKDPRCGGFVDIVEAFVLMMPTMTNEFPTELQIEIVDGLGTLTIPMDEYALEIKVSSLED